MMFSTSPSACACVRACVKACPRGLPSTSSYFLSVVLKTTTLTEQNFTVVFVPTIHDVVDLTHKTT